MIEATFERMMGWVKDLRRRVERLETVETTSAGWVILPLASALVSTSWDGDARSTTAKTIIDMSAVFSAPTNIDALMVRVHVRDSGAASTDCYLILADNDTAASGIWFRCFPVADRLASYTAVIPTNADGDIYFQTVASGTDTLDVTLVVYGYHLR